MIKHIVAVDWSGGYARQGHIPWNLSGDKAYYRDHIRGQRVLMGRSTYDPRHVPDTAYNYVLSHDTGLQVVNGEAVCSIEEAIRKNGKADLWVIGGNSVFTPTMTIADELYITRVEGNFECDRIYPSIPLEFNLTSRSRGYEENGIRYWYEVYVRSQSAGF